MEAKTCGSSKCVRVTSARGRPMRVNREPLTLCRLSLLLYAGTHESVEDVDLSQVVQFFSDREYWTPMSVSLDEIPDYPVRDITRLLNFSLHCERWGSGVIEFFFTDREFAHVGFQLAVRPSLLGVRRRKLRCLNCILGAMKEVYGSPTTAQPALGESAAMFAFRDETTLVTVLSGWQPVSTITLRIWNRSLCDPLV